jgi:hypothetical protein
MVLPLAKTRLDHVPFVVSIDTNILKARKFRFENYWVELPSFASCVSRSWSKESNQNYSSAILADKLKILRHGIKKW